MDFPGGDWSGADKGSQFVTNDPVHGARTVG